MTHKPPAPREYTIIDNPHTGHPRAFRKTEKRILMLEGDMRVDVVEKLAFQKCVEALKEAVDTIHSEFCCEQCHPLCIKPRQTLRDLGVSDE